MRNEKKIKKGESHGGSVESTESEVNVQCFMTTNGIALRFAVDKRNVPIFLMLGTTPLRVSRTARRMLRQVKRSATPSKMTAETRAPSITVEAIFSRIQGMY